MKFLTPEISWHNRDPLYSVDIQPYFGNIQRLASCGTDKNIRIWSIAQNDKGLTCVSYLSTLSRHSKTVNVVRFSPNGKLLASGGDDSFIILWQLNSQQSGYLLFDNDDDDVPSENWTVVKCLRSHLEDVYDLSWSADGDLLLSGSVDNMAILWDVKKGLKMQMFDSHKSYVQGVALDPLNKFIVTFSCDRSMKVHNRMDYRLQHDVRKVSLGGKDFKMFHDDSMKSFFRRLSFSPDGQVLAVPSGCLEMGPNSVDNTSNAIINTTFLFSRNDLSKPILHLPVPPVCKATLVVRFCPMIFKLRDLGKRKDMNSEEKYESILKLTYRLVFAVATENSVLLYDTQQPTAIISISNIHYDLLSDLAWSSDGKLLVVSSVDGYCTLITFDDGELGEAFNDVGTHGANSNQLMNNDQPHVESMSSLPSAPPSSRVPTISKEPVPSLKPTTNSPPSISPSSSVASPNNIPSSSSPSPPMTGMEVAPSLPHIAPLPPTNQSSNVPPPTNQSSNIPPPTNQSSNIPPPTNQSSNVPPPTNQSSNVPPPTNQSSSNNSASIRSNTECKKPRRVTVTTLVS